MRELYFKYILMNQVYVIFRMQISLQTNDCGLTSWWIRIAKRRWIILARWTVPYLGDCLIHRKWLTLSWKLSFRKECTIMNVWISKNPIQFIVWVTDHNCSLIKVFFCNRCRFSRQLFTNLNITNNGSRLGNGNILDEDNGKLLPYCW